MNANRCLTLLFICALCVCEWGCGSDYTPPNLTVSGELGTRLGQVIDVDVSLPNLQVPGVPTRGAELVLRIDIEEQSGLLLSGSFELVNATAGIQAVMAADLSAGGITLRRDGNSWTSSRLGPLVVEGAIFDLFLDGETSDDGWIISGQATETQTGLGGTFAAWRRHRFLVSTTDFFSDSGRISEVAWVRDQFIAVREGLELVSSDAVLELDDNVVLAINRFGFDNLQRLNPTADYNSSWQASVGVGSNPHDAAAIDSERWALTRYEPPFNDLLIFDPTDGSALDSVDLAPWARNPDGTPRPDQVRSVDGDLWVTLQDIDRTFTRYEQGRLLRIVPETLAIESVVELPGKNPTGLLRALDGTQPQTLAVVLSGIFPGLVMQELSGGIVLIDTQSGVASPLLLDDDRVQGNLGSTVWLREDLFYSVVSDASFQNRVVAFNPLTDELRDVGITGGFIPAIAASQGSVFAVPNRDSGAAELCLYRAPVAGSSVEFPLGCGNTSLPPFSVLALD